MTSLPIPIGLGITNCRRAETVILGIKEAESLGAEIAFIAEDINCRDAFQLAALAVEQTASIRLATGVVNPYTRNPTLLAMSAATLDEVSGGRAVLGMGTSSPDLISGEMGIAASGSVQTMREAITIVRALLSGEAVTYSGTKFMYRNARLRARTVQARVPIYMAAMGPRMLELAGAVADGVLLNVGASTEYVRWSVERIRTGAEAAGRDASEVTVAAWISAYVTYDREAGMQKAREWLAGVLSIPRQGELLLAHVDGDPAILPAIRAVCRAYPHDGDRKAGAELVPREIAERMAIVGNAEHSRERLAEYRDAGVQIPVVGLPALRALTASE